MKKMRKKQGTLREQLTLFPGGSRDDHANPTQWPGSEKAMKMTATSGRRCCELLNRSNQHGSWAKMFTGLLIGQEGWYSTRSYLTWKMQGMKYNRILFRLLAWMPRTEGIDYGLLPTVMACEGEKNMSCSSQNYVSNLARKGLLPTPQTTEIESDCELTETGRRKHKINGDSHSLNLGRMAKMMLPTPSPACVEGGEQSDRVEMTENGGFILRKLNKPEMTYGAKLSDAMLMMEKRGLLPTPNQRDWKGESGLENQYDLTREVMKMLPTPATRDYKGARTTETLEKSGRTETNSLPDFFNQPSTSSQLNPRFVAEMMGFPPDWLELPFQSTETKA